MMTLRFHRWLSLTLLMVALWSPTVTGQEEKNVVSPTTVDGVESRADDTNGNSVAVTEEDDVQYVQFNVQIDADTTDSFVVQVHPSWAPIGAARFLALVDSSFFDDVRFFRVIDGFVAQFGISGDPQVTAEWDRAYLEDDPVVASNVRGTLSYASAGSGTRTTQIFANLNDNTFLDNGGFAPFAQISEEDMSVVDQLYEGYGEGAPDGPGPSQGLVASQGNAYLDADFPLLSSIISVERIQAPPKAEDENGSTSTGTSTTLPIEDDSDSDTEGESENFEPTAVAPNDPNAGSSSVDRTFAKSKLLMLSVAVLLGQQIL